MLQETDDHPVVIPSSYKGANWQHLRIGNKVRKINKLNAKLTKRIKELKAQFGLKVSTLTSEVLALSEGIRLYANVHRAELLLGGGKTAKLPNGGAIQWEANDASLCYDLKEDEAVAIVEKAGMSDCIDREPRVNKTKVKQKLKTNPELLTKLPGFSLEGEDTETIRLIFSGLKQRVQGDSDEGNLAIVTPRDTKAAEPAAL